MSQLIWLRDLSVEQCLPFSAEEFLFKDQILCALSLPFGWHQNQAIVNKHVMRDDDIILHFLFFCKKEKKEYSNIIKYRISSIQVFVISRLDR